MAQDKVNFCWNFSSGKCDFGDNRCWFLYSDSSENPVMRIKCNICEKVFKIQDDFHAA